MFTKVIKALNGLIERLTPKQLLLSTAAIGLLICLLVYITLDRIEKSLIAEQPKPVEMTKVVVARINIPRGVILQSDMLRVKEFAVDSLPPGTADEVELFVGFPTRLEIFAGDIITSKKIFTDYRQAGFIGMIPDDCRAISIPIDNVTGISGLIKAGDYVDILRVSSEGKRGTKAEVILQNVLLLSINQNSDREIFDKKEKEDVQNETDETLGNEIREDAEDLFSKGEKINKDAADTFSGEGLKGLGAAGAGGEAESLGTATLALKPDDVLKVAAALESGTIQLALRPLKPKPSSMYMTETEYYMSGNDNSQFFLKRQNQEYRNESNPPPPPPAQVEKIPENPPPPLPVIPPPSLPNIGNGKSDGYEVVQWGN